MKGVDSLRDNLLNDVLKQKEKIILDQLGDLVKKGLLVIEETQPVLVQTHGPGFNMELRQAVRLVLKEREYVKRLEDENARMAEQIQTLKGILK